MSKEEGPKDLGRDAVLKEAIRAAIAASGYTEKEVGIAFTDERVAFWRPGDPITTLRVTFDDDATFNTLQDRLDSTAEEEHDDTSRPGPAAIRVRKAGRRRSVENELAPQPDLARLPATIRAARDHAEITLPELAERSGVSLGFLSSVENGHSVPRREKFEGVVEVLARDEPHARELRNSRNWQELVDRFGMAEGIAALAVVLGDEHRVPRSLLEALSRLTPEQRTSLDEGLRRVAAATTVEAAP